MKALIVDDERLARKELVKLLEEHPSIEIAGEAQNADEAEQMITELNPDLLFLDIQMPGRTGFQLLESLDTVPMVVFTTAYDEFALKWGISISVKTKVSFSFIILNEALPP